MGTIERRLADCPTKYRKLMERALAGECSPRAAIKAMCLQCVGYERREVSECTSAACPLFHLRPYQVAEAGTLRRAKASEAAG